MDKNEILAFLDNHSEVLRKNFQVRTLALFGSYARNAENSESDIDILVKFEKNTFDNYMELKFFLEDALGRKVDVVLAESLKPRIQPHIMKEAVFAKGLSSLS